MLDPKSSMLRAALGITHDAFELSDDDYYNLYQFDVPWSWEDFKHNCEQVKAKWPDGETFQRIVERYDQELEDDYR